jgi:outer membrane protein OmpA-like peptidoglycan-associated protein
MSRGNQRDLSGLLYLPGEELVRSTIDGDDADWSESLSYVPPDSLVRTVLDASRRERATFFLPATLLPNQTVAGTSNRARRTASMLAALGFSPLSLAAATVLHMAFLFAVGPWIATQANAARSIRTPPSPPPPIVATHLVYASSVSPPRRQPPRSGASPSPVVRQPSPVSTTEPPLNLDSARRRAAAQSERAAIEGEAANALSQEFFFAADRYELEARDRPKLELIVRILTEWPGLRVRALGAAPRSRERDSLPGMAEAEALKRALVQAGIDGERIEIGQLPEEDRRCPELEPNCAAARRRVRTMLAPSR